MDRRRFKKRDMVTAVEIGTHTIKVLIGEFLPDRSVSLIGVGVKPSRKVTKGEVMDAAVVQESLQEALAAAEEMAHVDIQNIFVAVTGGHIGSVNNTGSQVINSPDRRVTKEHVDQAMSNAVGVMLPPDKHPLHSFRRQFRVDGREVDNPIGMSGGKLEADVHIIYGQLSRQETTRSLLIEAVGIEGEPKDLVFSAVAAGMAGFTLAELEKGGLIIDVGAGVTEYAVFQGEEYCFHSGLVTVGCEHLANDLSLALHLPIQRSRELLDGLKTVGGAVMTLDGNTRMAEVEDTPGKPPRRIPASAIEQVIELRLQELFEVIKADLQENDVLKCIGFGAKLCGGGALIPRIADLARGVLEMPVEIALPRLVSGPKEILTSPQFVTPVGLLRYGKSILDNGGSTPVTMMEQLKRDAGNMFRLIKVRRPFQW